MSRARILALGLTGALFPGAAAWAQTVTVQSGEHTGFTRLVLDIGAERDWTLTGSGATRSLILDPPVDGFAIGRVFDLIPRTRLASLAADAELTLTLGCDCEISADRYEGRYLILDIAEGPPRELEEPQPAQLAAVERNAAAESLPDLTALLVENDPLLIPIAEPAAPPAPPPPVDMAEAARIMSEQLARAAASGLLEAAPGRPLSDADPGAAHVTADAPPSAAEAPPGPENAPAPGVPIRAATALDLLQAPRRDPMPAGEDLSCAGAALSIRDWSSGVGVDHGLGALRLALHDDRDRLQRDAALALARHYLSYGFGAEAAHVLAQVGDAPGELAVIAALVDGVEGPRFPAEPDPVTCSDEELLWRYLDGALGAQPPTDGTVGRLQRATAALPQTLRDQIAPRVARQLHADGFPQAARNLRDMVQRGGRLGPAQLLALDLALGLVSPGDPGTGQAVDLALRNDAADPVGAMTQALAFARDIGAPPDPMRLDAAEALLRENGINGDTAPLWHEVILARAATGGLDPVLHLLAQAGGLAQDRRDATLTALVADRVAAQDTAALFVLARLHGADWQATGSEAGRARVAAIALLREAGLSDAAEVLRAGQRPMILPARPAAAPDPGANLRSAWVLGDWPEVSAQASGAHLDIALRMDQRDDTVPLSDAAPDLPALAARVADSRALRDDIARLLANPSPDARE